MNTAFFLMAQYGATAVVPIEDVCRDYFRHLTPEKLVRKVSLGEIALPLVRIEASQKSAKGVHINDLADWIDAGLKAGAEAVSATDLPDPKPVTRALSMAQARAARISPVGIIYVLASGAYVKIGFTTQSVEQRVAGLQTGCPEAIAVIAQIKGRQRVENELHKRFAVLRTSGEWFRNEGAVAEWIAEGCPHG